jgi:hypothetical protein
LKTRFHTLENNVLLSHGLRPVNDLLKFMAPASCKLIGCFLSKII